MKIISIKELEDLTRRAIKKYGYSDEEVPIITDVMLYAQLPGSVRSPA